MTKDILQLSALDVLLNLLCKAVLGGGDSTQGLACSSGKLDVWIEVIFSCIQ